MLSEKNESPSSIILTISDPSVRQPKRKDGMSSEEFEDIFFEHSKTNPGPPYGFYHIMECWDYDKGCRVPIAFLEELSITIDEAIEFSKKIAQKYGCEFANKVEKEIKTG